jgi:hypothetical protein
MTAGARTKLRPVTRASPCAVCGGNHKCSRGDDGVIMCGRPPEVAPFGFVDLGPAEKDSQFRLYRRTDDPVVQEREREYQRARAAPLNGQHHRDHRADGTAHGPDVAALAAELGRNLTPARRGELAEALGLPESVLVQLPGLGYSSRGFHADRLHSPCWAFPEVDATGRVVGITCRYADGKKMAMPGGGRGLTVVPGWQDAGGPLFLPEGPSDTLALTALGLAAVGRPSNTGGVDHLAGLLRDVPANRDVIVVGEWDAKEDGSWPGLDGAKRTAAALAERLGRPTRWALPPRGAKDVREWVRLRRPDPSCADRWHDLGQELEAALREHWQAIAPAEGAPAFADPLYASQLAPGGAEADWLWSGYLARNSVTLLTSLWKAGKSTLLAHIVHGMGGGGDVAGRRMVKGNVLVISEESATLWAGRRDKLCIGDHAMFYLRPFAAVGRPDMTRWVDFLKNAARLVRERAVALVCIDTLAALSPCDDENDAAKMLAALNPLHLLTEAGAAVLVTHHPKKGDAGQGQASRGSGSLPGFCDVIVEMRRVRPQDRGNRQRELVAYSRFEETPVELVIELSEDRKSYAALGTTEEAERQSRAGVLAGLVPQGQPGKTADEILADWPDDEPRPGIKTLRIDLATGADARRWNKAGEGKKGKPYRFWRRGDSIPAHIGEGAAGIESGAAGTAAGNSIPASPLPKDAGIESGTGDGEEWRGE